jgi:hypothetical protein
MAAEEKTMEARLAVARKKPEDVASTVFSYSAQIRHIAERANEHGVEVFENLTNGYTIQTVSGRIIQVFTQQEAIEIKAATPDGVSPEEWILYIYTL